MSAGWQWAYRALKDGILRVEDIEDIIYSGPLSGKQFCDDAKRGIADYLEEAADEEKIARQERNYDEQADEAREEQDGRQGI